MNSIFSDETQVAILHVHFIEFAKNIIPSLFKFFPSFVSQNGDESIY